MGRVNGLGRSYVRTNCNAHIEPNRFLAVNVSMYLYSKSTNVTAALCSKVLVSGRSRVKQPHQFFPCGCALFCFCTVRKVLGIVFIGFSD